MQAKKIRWSPSSQRRDRRYRDAIKRLQDGAIGDILYTRVYWNGGGLWVKTREPEQSEMEYQMRNWYYFNWLCGDHIVEQHIHNLDVGNWMRGMHPVEAQGMGGRQLRTGKEYGQIFDHHFVEFTYPDGTKMFSQCRHWDGCAVEVREHAHGTKGTLDIDDGAGGLITGPEGKWRSPGRKLDNHHQEHHDMFAALRRGEIYNEGDYGANHHDGHHGPHGHLLRRDNNDGRRDQVEPRSVAGVVRFCGRAAGDAGCERVLSGAGAGEDGCAEGRS
jgi:predicted dehydrogenase